MNPQLTRRRSRRLPTLAAVVTLAILCLPVGDTVAGGIPSAKVTVCHLRGNGVYEVLTLPAQAIARHLAHGDALPHDAGHQVPGLDGYWFDEACEPFDNPPVIDDQQFSVLENSVNGALVGTIAALDPDTELGDLITFTVTGGSGQTAFSVDDTGSVTVADSVQLDYEITTVFTLEISVFDLAGRGASATVTVDIGDVAAVSVPALSGDFMTADLQPPLATLPAGATPCSETGRDPMPSPWDWIPQLGLFYAAEGCEAYNNVTPIAGLRHYPEGQLDGWPFWGGWRSGPWTDYLIEAWPGVYQPYIRFGQWSVFTNRLEFNALGEPGSDGDDGQIVDFLARSGWQSFEPFDPGLGVLQAVEVHYFGRIDGMWNVSLCDEGLLTNAEVETVGGTTLEVLLDGANGGGHGDSQYLVLGSGHLTDWSCGWGALVDNINMSEPAFGGAPSFWDALSCATSLWLGDSCVYEGPDWTAHELGFGSQTLPEYDPSSPSHGTRQLSPEDYAANLGPDGSFRVGLRSADYHSFWYEGGDTYDSSSFH